MVLCDTKKSGTTYLLTLFALGLYLACSSRDATTHYMSWITQVPAWVIPLLQAYLIPDDAAVQVGVDFDSFGGGDGTETSTGQNFSMSYPGLVPSYALEPIVQPQTNGIQYILKAKKAVGFYGVKTEVISYESNRINRWEFPIDRKQFGWISLGRQNYVMSDDRIAYAQQIHTCVPATLLLLNYDDQFNSENLLNSADKLTATQVHARLSPTVKIQVTPLPTWEVWAIRFFRENED